MSVRRRRSNSSDAESLLPLLDTLSNGVGAAVLLFLVFTVAGASIGDPPLAVRESIMVELELPDQRDQLLLWVDPVPRVGQRREPIALFDSRARRLTEAHTVRLAIDEAMLAAFVVQQPDAITAFVHLELIGASSACWRFQFSRANRLGHWYDSDPGPTVLARSVGMGAAELELRGADLSSPICLQRTPMGTTTMCPGTCPYD